jgi:signal transduction histidine kinase
MDRVLQALVDVTVDLLHTDKSMIFLWDEEQGHYAVKVARNLSAAAMAQLTFRRGEGTVGQVTETGDPLIVRDIQTDVRRENERPEILALADRERVRAFMNIPLQVHAQVFGIFSVAFEKPHLFGTAEQRLYLALAQRAAVAIENAQLYERAQQAAALEERNRLARELHDAVTQTLFSASLIADVLPKIWERNAEEGRSRLQDLRQLSRGALAEMRTLLLELRPASLQEAKLPELLRQLAEAFSGRTGVPVQLEVTSASAPPVAVKVALYRIAQEALNNIVKHASPTAVTIGLHGVPDGSGAEGFELWVTDDGCGFDPAHVPSDHLGLKIMRERAQAIGAEFQLDSQPGQGTRVFVRWNAPPS